MKAKDGNWKGCPAFALKWNKFSKSARYIREASKAIYGISGSWDLSAQITPTKPRPV